MKMVNFLYRSILCLFLITLINAQGTWQFSNRVHPERDWFTLETQNFNIHYHDGIKEIAREGASIAEQILPTLLKQMGQDTIPRIDIIFTSIDEVMNGYAMWTYQTYIWVDQNDAALWLEDEKWLFQVVAHELQHIVLLHSVRSWVPEPFGSFIFSGMPGWFVEGSAEYYTERWRPWRADISHKYHVLTNSMDRMNPHHDGFSKMKYWSERFGDSTIVKTVNHRDKFKLFNFDKAFKKATGTKRSQFEEDWRRHMNTYYYGYRAQKEAFEEVGKVSSLPLKKMASFAISPDSLRIAITGIDNNDQLELSLYIATRDTTTPDTSFFERLITDIFHTEEDTTEKESAPKPSYDLEEMDFGSFHQSMSWSPDSKNLVYAKYHYGAHQSLVWDLRVVEIETGKARWITDSFRANNPAWSPDGGTIAFVAHQNNVSNIYTINPDGIDRNKVTEFNDNTQIISLAWSPGGDRLAYAKSGPGGNMDLYILELASGASSRATTDSSVDYLPVWHPDENKITFTSHRGSTPNLHTVDLTTGNIIQNTDVGDAIWSMQWVPGGDKVLSRTSTDVDSVRIVAVDPARKAETSSLAIRDRFTTWRTTMPPDILDRIDPQKSVEILGQKPYRFYSNIRHFMSFALPTGTGLFGLTSFTDGTGRHLFQAIGGMDFTGTTDPYFGFSYLNAEHGPLWSVSYNHNFRWQIREYDRSYTGLRETLDGVVLAMNIPYNFGTSMSSLHMLGASLSMHNRQAAIGDSIDQKTGEPVQGPEFTFKDLPKPESGNEGIAAAQYLWLNRRPDRTNIFLPKQGHGFLTTAEIANKALKSDFDYTRLTLDAFANVPVGPTAIFLRVKGMALFGDPPAQDTLALTRDNSYYLPGLAGAATAGLVMFPETHNLRGWDQVRMGDRLVFGTAEYRFPLIPELPINVLGFTLGSITGAVFSDFGNAWSADQGAEDWVTTAGYEVKVALEVGMPILIFGIGEAQRISEWQDNKTPNYYARLALINPF